jgi:biopolymer transport protein ExbB
VGAVVAVGHQVVATGANDCPKAGGGLYWPTYNPQTHEIEDQEDGRDYMRGEDSNKIEQQKIIGEGRRARTSFWQSANLREGANKLDRNGAYRQIVDDGLLAQDQHSKLTDPVDQHDWMLGSLSRTQGAITAKLGTGLALLATVGSTAPFVGLFGTVVGIYRALIRIGQSGQASIDAVAGPVGESLIMTALGLAVAVPAVMQYNWLMRRNKAIVEELGRFSNDLHGYMMSGGSLRPTPATARTPAAASRPAATTGAASTAPKA